MANILFPELSDYLNKISKSSDPLLSEMEDFARLNKVPILEKISAEFLEQLLYLYSPKSFLEIGMAIGYSTIRVAKILKNKAKIETIELSKPNIKIAKSNIAKAGLSKFIKVHEGNALEILPTLNPGYDFIFLDADKEDYSELFNLSISLLSERGVILIDNLLWKGYVASAEVPNEYKKSTEFIIKFNAEFLSHPKLKSSILPIGDGLGLGIKLK